MEAEQLDAYEMGKDAGKAEHALWCGVLMQFVTDAKLYWRGNKYSAAPDYELEQAFDDLVRCGPMLRHVCNMTGHDAEWISKGFIQWCEDMA